MYVHICVCAMGARLINAYLLPRENLPVVRVDGLSLTLLHDVGNALDLLRLGVVLLPVGIERGAGTRQATKVRAT